MLTEFPPAGTPYPGDLKVGEVPLVADGSGMWTVPEEHRRTPLIVDADFIEYGQSRKAQRTPADYFVYLFQRYVSRVPLMERFHI